jgi:chromosome segregation ATPase
MLNTITIVLVFLTLSAVAAAGFAVLYLSRVKRNLSELGMRVLESQDIGKIKEAANKAGSLESRMAECEHKADENKNQLAENKTNVNEFTNKLTSSEQKIMTFEGRFDELTTKLESVEQKANKNEDSLAQTVPNIKALADEIQNIKTFQTATEKIHSLIQTAFTDIQASVPPEEVPVTTTDVSKQEDMMLEDIKSEEAMSEEVKPEEAMSEEVKPEEAMSEETKSEETLKELEEWQNEDEPQKVSGSRRWQS